MKQAYTYDKVFYCAYQTDESVETPSPINPKELPDLLKRITNNKENFIGFVDEQETTLQFYINGDNDITVDIPDTKKNGSYTKEIKISRHDHFTPCYSMQ